MSIFEFTAQNINDTQRLASALAESLPPGAVIALNGTLGAGKTRLVQEFARCLEVPENTVVSPTFVLIQEYAGRVPIYHFDVYRIADDDEFLQLGPDEYFESDGYTFLEWANRVQRCLPRSYVQIDIEVLGETERRFQIIGIGKRFEDVPGQLAQALE